MPKYKRTTVLKIEIKESRNQAYSSCVQEGCGLIGFKVLRRTDGNVAILTIRSSQRLAEALKFIALCKPLRKKRVYWNGVEQDWKRIFEFLDCYESKSTGDTTIDYCHGITGGGNNIFGCQLLAGWHFGKHGAWKRQRWYFDKAMISKDLVNQLGGGVLCPAQNVERLNEIVSALPHHVDPLAGNGWCLYKNPIGPQDVIHTIEIQRGIGKVERVRVSGVGPSAQMTEAIEDLNTRLRTAIPEDVAGWSVVNMNLDHTTVY